MLTRITLMRLKEKQRFQEENIQMDREGSYRSGKWTFQKIDVSKNERKLEQSIKGWKELWDRIKPVKRPMNEEREGT